jgi:hypothetical protein
MDTHQTPPCWREGGKSGRAEPSRSPRNAPARAKRVDPGSLTRPRPALRHWALASLLSGRFLASPPPPRRGGAGGSVEHAVRFGKGPHQSRWCGKAYDSLSLASPARSSTPKLGLGSSKAGTLTMQSPALRRINPSPPKHLQRGGERKRDAPSGKPAFLLAHDLGSLRVVAKGGRFSRPSSRAQTPLGSLCNRLLILNQPSATGLGRRAHIPTARVRDPLPPRVQGGGRCGPYPRLTGEWGPPGRRGGSRKPCCPGFHIVTGLGSRAHIPRTSALPTPGHQGLQPLSPFDGGVGATGSQQEGEEARSPWLSPPPLVMGQMGFVPGPPKCKGGHRRPPPSPRGGTGIPGGDDAFNP